MADSAPPDILRGLCALEGYQSREVVDGLDELFRRSAVDPSSTAKLAGLIFACPALRAAAIAQIDQPPLAEHIITARKIFVSRDGPLTMIGVSEHPGACTPDQRFRATQRELEKLRDDINACLLDFGVGAL